MARRPLDAGDGWVTFEHLEARVLLDSSIQGQLFQDLDNDGRRDAGEVGLDGWTVELHDLDGGGVVATTTTYSADLDASGSIDAETESGLYSFSGAYSGSYDVRLVVEPGYEDIVKSLDALKLSLEGLRERN